MKLEQLLIEKFKNLPTESEFREWLRVEAPLLDEHHPLVEMSCYFKLLNSFADLLKQSIELKRVVNVLEEPKDYEELYLKQLYPPGINFSKWVDTCNQYEKQQQLVWFDRMYIENYDKEDGYYS